MRECLGAAIAVPFMIVLAPTTPLGVGAVLSGLIAGLPTRSGAHGLRAGLLSALSFAAFLTAVPFSLMFGAEFTIDWLLTRAGLANVFTWFRFSGEPIVVYFFRSPMLLGAISQIGVCIAGGGLGGWISGTVRSTTGRIRHRGVPQKEGFPNASRDSTS